MQEDDQVLFVDASAGDIEITLPLAVVENRALEFKRIDVGVHVVTILPQGTDLIDWLPSFELPSMMSVGIKSISPGWFLF